MLSAKSVTIKQGKNGLQGMEVAGGGGGSSLVINLLIDKGTSNS